LAIYLGEKVPSVEPQSFSAQAIFTIAGTPFFNTPLHEEVTEENSYKEIKKTLGSREIKPVDAMIHSTAIQFVARLIAAIAITIFVAPIGMVYHLGRASWHLTLYTVDRLFHKIPHSKTKSHYKKFQAHFAAGMMDTLASVNAATGIFFLFNPLAIHFAWDPNKVGAFLLPGRAAVAASIHLELKSQFGIQINADKIRMDTQSLAKDASTRRPFLNTQDLIEALQELDKIFDGLPEVPATSKTREMKPFFKALNQLLEYLETVRVRDRKDKGSAIHVNIRDEKCAACYGTFFEAFKNALVTGEVEGARRELEHLEESYQNASALVQISTSVQKTLESEAKLYYLLAPAVLTGKVF